MSDPSTDPVGTVRREEHEDGYSIWIRVGRSMVEGYGSNAVVFVKPAWRCVYSTVNGNSGATFAEIPDFPVIGAVPGTPAAEPKADQRWRDRQGDVWLETSDVGRLLRLVEFKGQTHLDGSVQEFADVEATWGPLALIPQWGDAAGKTCSCAPLLTSAGPRRLTAPKYPEHGEGK